MKKKTTKKDSPANPVPPPQTPPRKMVLVVDDHPMMRAGLAQLIGHQPDLRAAGEAGNPAEALALLAKGLPDLVLTDVTMPGRSGLEFIKDLRALHPGLAILVVSMHDELIYAERFLRAGARGYIMKEAGSENLLAAIRHVLGGQVYVSPRMSGRILEHLSAAKPRGSTSPVDKLSDREFEVFQLIGQGKATREVAKHLGISPKTVDVHRARIKEKLELKDATALVRHAVRWVETQSLASS